MEGSYILLDNLKAALHTAIQSLEDQGAGDTAQCAGWRANLNFLNNHWTGVLYVRSGYNSKHNTDLKYVTT